MKMGYNSAIGFISETNSWELLENRKMMLTAEEVEEKICKKYRTYK